MPTVLIVDDDEGIRESLDLLLTSEGYSVLIADGGFCALEVLRESAGPAIVLFDFLMSKGDGLDLLRGVSDDETLMRQNAYICMAARRRSVLPEELQILMDQLDVPFVTKPFDVDDLLATVAEAQSDLATRLAALPHPREGMPPGV